MRNLTTAERKILIGFFREHPEEVVKLLEEILEIASEKAEIKNEIKTENNEAIVTKYLNEIGIARNINGFNYCRYAICLCIDEPRYLKGVTKELYPDVAAKFQTTPSKVERAIRHAIEKALKKGNIQKLQELFGYSVSSSKGKPTNSEFIALLADQIRMQLKKIE